MSIKNQSGVSNEKSGCSPAKSEFKPEIDRNRCEGKADCVRVCPYDVFEIRTLGAGERKLLSLRGKLKAWAHGGKQAHLVHPDACHACSLCVKTCPENALKLVRIDVSAQ